MTFQTPQAAAACLLAVALFATVLPLAASAADRASSELLVYVGTYTGPKSKGIYLFHLDTASGKLTPAGAAGETPSPSFLAIRPDHRFLYAVNEISSFNGKKSGAVTAFAIDPHNGKLTQLNQQSSEGDGPCFITADKAGKNVLVANYGGGSIASLPIREDGSLGPAVSAIQHHGTVADPQRQGGPHAHSINLDAANHFAVAADLGLDQMLVYRFDSAKGTLAPNDPPFAKVAPRSGPRHFSFHPDGQHAYLINEIALTVTAFEYDPKKGVLKSFQTISTLPEGVTDRKGFSTAQCLVHPGGKFLYGSNRGHDTIVIYAIEPGTGRLTLVGHQPTGGKTPRNFNIDPSGNWLLAANQDSDSITVFRIDQATGKLSQVGDPVQAPMPVCVQFMPAPH